MTNKQAYIDFILDEINKGNVKYNDVCAVFCSKFHLTERTFNKYWLKANESYKEQLELIKKEKLSTIIEEEKKAVKTLILDKTARMKIAEEIAIGKAKRVEGEIIMPNFSDRIRALDYLSKIEGDYSKIKIEQTNREAPTIDVISLSDEELKLMNELFEKSSKGEK